MTFSSVSALKTFLECPKKYELAYVERLSPKVAPGAFWLGTAIHRILQVWYESLKPGRVDLEVEKILDELSATLSSMPPGIAKNLGILRGVAATYPAWALRHDTFTVRGVEVAGRFDELNYRLDGLVEMPDGHPNAGLWVLEHKTHSLGRETRYHDTARFDLQPLVYSSAVPGIKGIIYNFIGKPAIRLRVGETDMEFSERLVAEYKETPDRFFTRAWYPVTAPREAASAEIRAGKALLDAAEKSGYPKNTMACNATFPCQFLKLCSGEIAEIEDLYVRRP